VHTRGVHVVLCVKLNLCFAAYFWSWLLETGLPDLKRRLEKCKIGNCSHNTLHSSSMIHLCVGRRVAVPEPKLPSQFYSSYLLNLICFPKKYSVQMILFTLTFSLIFSDLSAICRCKFRAESMMASLNHRHLLSLSTIVRNSR